MTTEDVSKQLELLKDEVRELKEGQLAILQALTGDAQGRLRGIRPMLERMNLVVFGEKNHPETGLKGRVELLEVRSSEERSFRGGVAWTVAKVAGVGSGLLALGAEIYRWATHKP